MENGKKKHGKYSSVEQLDNVLKDYIMEKAKEGELPCALAFEIADKKGMPIDEVGNYADLLEIRLTKCRLGLFGHTPDKKRVKPVHASDPGLKNAIENSHTQGRLSCKEVWDIASSQKCKKMDVSCACEAMKMKITNCQLGAF